MTSPGLDLPHRHKSEMHARLARLKFDTPHNAAVSLGIIAEYARTGKLRVAAEHQYGAVTIKVST